ncbi:MAG: hypothetical protein GY765_25310, partial [bacterium]|nr:hypothetical protein [bacterium]
ISDVRRAHAAGTVSTGNGFRSERSLFPNLRFSNLYIKPTVLPLKNLLEDAGRGVLVSLLKLKSVEKDHYIFSAYGYIFNGDQIGEPVHFFIKTAFPGYFLNVVKVSKGLKFFSSVSNIGSPYVLVKAKKKNGLLEI